MCKCLNFLVSSSVLIVLVLLSSACSNPKIQTQENTSPSQARLTAESVVMADGYVLPMRTWISKGAPTAVVIAMHGFNDYSNAFDDAAGAFADG